MPPKPQVFKTPDGKEFSTRAEWRDYMLNHFYSFKNKVNEPQPLIKAPGTIEGQVFDIADCSNSTLVVADHTEQVQIDQCHNCKIFIAACASSIFIRNCTNCTFYVVCRQLRLREVTGSTFYTFSQSEIHIEYSNNNKFGPFNGGYEEQAKHLKAANLDLNYNLWYDIYDHNDPGKTGANWTLLKEEEYEEMWFPLGNACEPAIKRTKPGSVHRTDENAVKGDSSFGLQQMIKDAEQLKVNAPQAPTNNSNNNLVPPPAPSTDKQVAAASTESVSDSISKVVQAYLSAVNIQVIASSFCKSLHYNYHTRYHSQLRAKTSTSSKPLEKFWNLVIW